MEAPAKDIVYSYRTYLNKSGIEFIEEGNFLRSGKIHANQGWMLYISMIPNHFTDKIHGILSVLSAHGQPFKIVKALSSHKKLNDGELDMNLIGKVITVYLEDKDQADSLIKELRAHTKDIIGPPMLTAFSLGDNLYIKYGVYQGNIKTDAWGNLNRFLVNNKGDEVKDLYYNPPIAPPWDPLPISTEQEAPQRKSSRLLNGKYMFYKRIKSDTKGDVIICAYLYKGFIPKFCIIKLRKANMFCDEYGRDIRFHLRWQYEVNKDIESHITTPKFIELFESNEMIGLVSECIFGPNLAELASQKMKAEVWSLQTSQFKSELMGHLIQVLRYLQSMHSLGYVHRDIKGSNFLVDKGKVYFIDLEIAYSFRKNLPSPFIGNGTQGFSSPQQAGFNIPIPEDDIYSFGAMLTQLFLGDIEPMRILEEDTVHLEEKLFFFFRSRILVNLILSCLQKDPANRPSWKVIGEILETYRSGLTEKAKPNLAEIPEDVPVDALHEVVQQGIDGLNLPVYSHKGLWTSHVQNQYDREVYPLGNRHTYWAVHRGAAGVLYLFSIAQRTGMDISGVNEMIGTSWDFIIENVVNHPESLIPGLHFGTAGVAVTIALSLNSLSLPAGPHWQKIIGRLILRENTNLDLQTGMTGQGLAILQCLDVLEIPGALEHLEKIVHTLLGLQEADGAWRKNAGEATKVNGFAYGIAGVVYFLLEYGYRYRHASALEGATRGLAYLEKKMIRRKDSINWPNDDSTKNTSAWWCHGGPGISLSFFRGYEVLGNPAYLAIAEKALSKHPLHLVYPGLTQCHGMSGLGEIYLEAWRVTGKEEWWKRAEWIGKAMSMLRMIPEPGKAYWISEASEAPTADLMLGSAGILHFLLHLDNPEKISFPLLPKPAANPLI